MKVYEAKVVDGIILTNVENNNKEKKCELCDEYDILRKCHIGDGCIKYICSDCFYDI